MRTVGGWIGRDGTPRAGEPIQGVYSLRDVYAARLAGTWPASADPYWASVVSLARFNGPDASTTFFDEVPGRNWSAVGNAQIDTAQSKFGGASLLLDGSGDRAQLAYSPDIDISSGDFTLEFFSRTTQTTAAAAYCEWRAALNGTGIFISQQASTPDRITFTVGDSNQSSWEFARDSSAITANTWYHVALTREGTTLRAFVDGLMLGTAGAMSADIFINGADLFLGTRRDGSQGHNGWLDLFRLTKGVARYTTDFTPPVAEF